ncbi:beta-secretase 2 isoform X2 [Anas acuta]
MNSHTDTWTHGHRHPTARIPGGPDPPPSPRGSRKLSAPGPSLQVSQPPPPLRRRPGCLSEQHNFPGREEGEEELGAEGWGEMEPGRGEAAPAFLLLLLLLLFSPAAPARHQATAASLPSPAAAGTCLRDGGAAGRPQPPAAAGRRRGVVPGFLLAAAPRVPAGRPPGVAARPGAAAAGERRGPAAGCPGRAGRLGLGLGARGQHQLFGHGGQPAGGLRPRVLPGDAPRDPAAGVEYENHLSFLLFRQLNILVDTGSSNFAVAGVPDPDVTSYFNTELSSTYKSQGIDVTVKYSQGSWTGVLGTDVITIPKGIDGSYTINIATIFESENFFLPGVQWHGILGLAYGTLAKMCGAGLPVSGSGTNGGSLVLGGIEPSLYRGDIWYTPIKEEWYYQVEILKLEVGGQNLELDCREYNADKAIVDSGTTLLRLPQKVFSAVVQAIARKSLVQEFSSGFWTGTQLACWDKTERPWSLFPKLSIYMRDENSSRSFRISILPQLYIQPILGIGENLQCYRFGISSSANALVIGATVMEGFYVIFDRAQRRVGFAVSPCAEVDGSPVSEIEGPFTTEDVASNCVSVISFHEPVLWIASYALMSLCGIILLALIILLLIPPRCQHRYTDNDVVNDESSLVRHRWK